MPNATTDLSSYPYTLGLPKRSVHVLLCVFGRVSSREWQAAYRAYLRTDHWRAAKAKAFEVHGRVCMLCRNSATQVHHRDHKCLFREDAEKDLTVLCLRHHKQIS